MQISGQEMVMLVTVVGDREKERFLNICLSPGGSEREGWSLLAALRGAQRVGERTWLPPSSPLVSSVFWGKSVNLSEVWEMEIILVTPGHDGLKWDSL